MTTFPMIQKENAQYSPGKLTALLIMHAAPLRVLLAVEEGELSARARGETVSVFYQLYHGRMKISVTFLVKTLPIQHGVDLTHELRPEHYRFRTFISWPHDCTPACEKLA